MSDDMCTSRDLARAVASATYAVPSTMVLRSSLRYAVKVDDDGRAPVHDLVVDLGLVVDVHRSRPGGVDLPAVRRLGAGQVPPEEPGSTCHEQETASWAESHGGSVGGRRSTGVAGSSAGTVDVHAATDAAVARHPHLVAPLEPGWVRVDLHSHTMWSGDSTTTPDEVEAAVVAAGLDVVCITDHHAVKGAFELAERLPCRVVVGEELRTHHGEIIGLFLTERIPFGTPPAEAARAIRDQWGRLRAAPLRPHAPQPHRAGAGRTGRRRAGRCDRGDQREDIARQPEPPRRELRPSHGLAAGAGSDAHVPLALGSAYVEMPDFDGPTDFLAKLALGRPVGHHWDEARPWTPRVLPSTSAG